ncbi:integrase [Actinoplanes sp. NPDC026670]|uniref:tyrosine-type recombinase/integrase n=1 Tax=Actinoplanes sp. NPDC026670 TaxID=3154700 RepID=UPI0033DCC70D
MKTSHDVQIFSIEERKYAPANGGKPRVSHRVRWRVAGQKFGDTFHTKALAESFRSRLITHQREGTAFDTASGLPEPMARELSQQNWFEHAIAYAEMKWPHVAAKHRKGIAETLAGVTVALIQGRRGAPSDALLRRALITYAFNKPRRTAGPPPAELASAVSWLEDNPVNLGDLAEPAAVRKVLDSLALKLDGTAAAASTVGRKKAVFSGSLRYAVELGHLAAYPMDRVKWMAPKKAEEVDRTVVANPEQARRLLRAVRETTPEMEAFFGAMYYAGLRPEEVLNLHDLHYERPREPDGWGWLHLGGAAVEVGEAWTDTGESIEYRALKHRGEKDTRDVPAEPALCALLDWHIKKYPPGKDGRLFVTRRGPGGMYRPSNGKPVTANARHTAWRKAREKGLTPAELAAGVAPVPYSLRHACLSGWLNAGVSAALVATWAGHSIAVLLKIYAKCLYGEQEAALRRIEAFRQGYAAPEAA